LRAAALELGVAFAGAAIEIRHWFINANASARCIGDALAANAALFTNAHHDLLAID
jgi:hypothetical protein